MKKLISLALALMLVFSLATVAMAATSDYSEHINTPKNLKKTYNVIDGTAPAEVFTFTFTPYSYKNGDGELWTYDAATQTYNYAGTTNPAPALPAGFSIPTLGDKTISFDSLTSDSEGTAAISVDPTSSAWKLGVYTYLVKETKGTTAGTVYDTNPLYLVVTIIRDETAATETNKYVVAMHYETPDNATKTEGFTNTYNAGTLAITKNITGNSADMTKTFTFTVELSAPENTFFKAGQVVAASGAPANTTRNETKDNNNNVTKVTFTAKLGNNATLTIENVPVGTTYTVKEDAENYTAKVQEPGATSASNYTSNTALNGSIATVTSADGKVTGAEDDAYVFTNDLTNTVDTGITLDSLPFVLILAVCAGAVVLFVIKRRRSVDF